MPKYEFEGTITLSCSGEVEADSLEQAKEFVRYDMDYHETERFTEIDWIGEVED